MSRHFPLFAKILLWFFLNLVLLAAVFYLLLRAQMRLGMNLLLSMGAEERVETVTQILVNELNDRPRSEWNDLLKEFDLAYQNDVQFYLFDELGAQLAGEKLALPAEVRDRLAQRRGPPRLRPPEPQSGRSGPPRMGPGLGRGDAPLISPGFGPRRGEGRGFRPGEMPEGLLPDIRLDPAPLQPPRLGMAGEMPASSNLISTPLESPRLGGRLDRRPMRAPLHSPHPKYMVRTGEPPRYWVLVEAVVNNPVRPRPAPVTLMAVSSSFAGGGLFFDSKPWLYVGLGAVVISALLWFPFVRRITRSIGQITQATRQIAEGRFDVRVDEQRRDELGLLGHSINQMALRLGGLVTGQKRFLGDVAHELCSPLARLRMALGILEQRASEQQMAYVTTASEKAGQIASLVNELLSFSKAALGASSIKLQRVAIRDIARQAVSRETAEGSQIFLDIPDELNALAEPELLLRSLANLLRNAIRYAGLAGPITVSARREGGEVVITVADCGPGVPEKELAQIFDPFYRVESSRDRTTGGVGLGLAIVKACIESCGGTVTCHNRQPAGLAVVVKLGNY